MSAFRRVGYAEVFHHFQAHYRFNLSLCHSYDGREKSDVRSSISTIVALCSIRIPVIWSFDGFNAVLFDKCMAKAEKLHYCCIIVEGDGGRLIRMGCPYRFVKSYWLDCVSFLGHASPFQWRLAVQAARCMGW